MAEVQHAQIKSKLKEQIVPSVDGSDLKSYSGDDLENHLLSRAITTVSLMIAADIDLITATNSNVDGGDDNGLDAIHYDPVTKTLYLVQGKWSNSHGSSIGSGEILKFLQGVQDLVSEKKSKFNEKIQKRWSIIQDALVKVTSVQLIIAFPGSSKIDSHIADRIDEFVKGQNDTSDLFYSETISQKELFSYFVQEAAPPQINLSIRLAHYGIVDSPMQAVYGQISAADIALWYKQHGNHLFAGNIRNFLGLKSEVNAGISKTLSDAPANFWYFNNGITLIVQTLKKQAIGGNDKSIGFFDCTNVTVVNGAQTVGTIGREADGTINSAFLQARVIVIDDPNSTLWQQITRASNTQNKIDARNFVALDPEQERIRTELLIEGITYEFREGEQLDNSSDGFEFVEGIIALSCAGNEMSYVALAKGYVGGLYADIASAPYKALFNSGTSSSKLWSAIQLGRRIDKVIKSIVDHSSPTQRGIVVHGNRFLLHCTFKAIEKSFDLSQNSLIPDLFVTEIASATLSSIDSVVKSDHGDSYLAPLFKNVSKCLSIKNKL